jgi:hypothetical protein
MHCEILLSVAIASSNLMLNAKAIVATVYIMSSFLSTQLKVMSQTDIFDFVIAYLNNLKGYLNYSRTS